MCAHANRRREAFKLHGFDGIAYKSSYGEHGFNAALFDIGAGDLLDCGLSCIKDVSVDMTERDNPDFVRKKSPAGRG